LANLAWAKSGLLVGDDPELKLPLEQLQERVKEEEAAVQQMCEEQTKLQLGLPKSVEEIEVLEAELTKLTEEATESGRKFNDLKHEVDVLVEENHRRRKLDATSRDQIESTNMSRAECFELVHTLSAENDSIRVHLRRIEDDRATAEEYRSASQAALRKAQKQLEPLLEQARMTRPRAAEVRNHWFTRFAAHVDRLQEIPGTEDIQEAVDLMDGVIEMQALAEREYTLTNEFLDGAGTEPEQEADPELGPLDPFDPILDERTGITPVVRGRVRFDLPCPPDPVPNAPRPPPAPLASPSAAVVDEFADEIFNEHTGLRDECQGLPIDVVEPLFPFSPPVPPVPLVVPVPAPPIPAHASSPLNIALDNEETVTSSVFEDALQERRAFNIASAIAAHTDIIIDDDILDERIPTVDNVLIQEYKL
jgi:hypothetical protein